MAEVEEMIKKLQSQSGVTGVVVTDQQGRTIKATMDDIEAAKYSNLLTQLCHKTKTVFKEVDQSNELNFIRVYTNKEEFMIAPQKEYTMIVIRELESKPSAL
uniref:Dynein light chain roadblock n=1 Tax=Rhabditophanes sp. KR3021 TaxID=114890 RepID=A0AC35UDB6_9BILA